MLRITVMSGPQDGQEVRVPGPVAHIGPPVESDLRIPHDPEFPSEGAVIELQDGGILLRYDGESRRIGSAGLIRLGRTWLRATLEDVQ
ncbi:MAG TPA: hypothetical protein VFJ58_07950 [Armatimonadota bacterium]|nr:hypothetical protein [Armatimonadota bacterium]